MVQNDSSDSEEQDQQAKVCFGEWHAHSTTQQLLHPFVLCGLMKSAAESCLLICIWEGSGLNYGFKATLGCLSPEVFECLTSYLTHLSFPWAAA